MIKQLKTRKAFFGQAVLCIGLASFAGILLLPSCSRSLELEKLASPPVLSVKETGARGDGLADDTKALQDAIDKVAGGGGGTVVIPRGKYMINTDTSLKLRSRVNLVLADTNTHLVAIPSNKERFYILLIKDVTDASVSGGQIIGERYQHTGTTGEWGHGIAVYGGRRIRIYNTRISNCWGDGISAGARQSQPSEHITIKRVICDNNRRQGLSIGATSYTVVDSCEFINTDGTRPMYGIDIEPDNDTARDITITNSKFANNKGGGIQIYQNANSKIFNVEIHKNTIFNNAYGGYIIRGRHIRFNYNRIYGNKYGPPIKCSVDTVDCIIEPNTYQ